MEKSAFNMGISLLGLILAAGGIGAYIGHGIGRQKGYLEGVAVTLKSVDEAKKKEELSE